MTLTGFFQVALAAMAFLSPAMAVAQLTVRSVDLQRAGSECDEGKEVAARLAAKQSALQKELDREKAQLQQDHARFEEKKSTLSRTEASKQEAELKKRYESLQQKFASSMSSLDRARHEEMRRMEVRVRIAVERVARPKDLEAVVWQGGEAYLMPSLKNHPRFDMTDEVIRELNAMWKKK